MLPVATIALLDPPPDLREKQLQDSLTGQFLRAKEAKVKPTERDALPMSTQARRLLQIWEQLVIFQGLLYRQYANPDDETVTLQLLVPACMREEILKDLHEGAMGGHLGGDKTFGRVKERYYWPGYHNDVREWVQRCGRCAMRKTPTPKNRASLQSMKTGYPMQLVAVDILGPFPESDSGNSYILMVADYFTRWMEVYPIPNQEARTVAKKITDEFFFRFSPPDQLHSDQGRQFESELMAEVCKLLGIHKSRTTPSRPLPFLHHRLLRQERMSLYFHPLHDPPQARYPRRQHRAPDWLRL